MKAIVITRPGGPEVLEIRDVPQPSPAAGQVLVRVRATAVNRADLLQVRGKYPAPAGVPPDIPGLEFAGEIAEIGSKVSGWQAGDRVFGIAGGGTYAEYVAVDAGALARIPHRLSWTDAAAIPEAFITAHDAMITQAELRPGESVLIHAVGSGVGLAAVQVARWRGATAFGTTRTAGKLDAARRFGLAEGVHARGDLTPIVEAVRSWRGDAGMDVVIDLVGGDYLPIDLEVLGPRGRLVIVGTVAGNRAEVRLDRILRKRLTVRGTVLRSRSDVEKADATAAFVRDLLPAFESGTLQPSVHAVLSLSEARGAHSLVAEDRNTGKVVLHVS